MILLHECRNSMKALMIVDYYHYIGFVDKNNRIVISYLSLNIRGNRQKFFGYDSIE